MRILVAPQEFKGTLTASDAARAMEAGIRRALPDVFLDVCPIADGGPGTVQAFLDALGGERRVARVLDPLGRPVDAGWALLEDATAVIEMAAASGLALLRPEERDPRRATTFGTGELIRAALGAGCRKIIVGVGGSATNDGGTGAASALGVCFLDGKGRPLPPGGAALAQLSRIDVSGRDPRLVDVDLVVATDVTSPLYGPEGASVVYGPQKGADEATVKELDAALAHLAAVVERQLGLDLAFKPGAGAAGGLAYGLSVFCGARMAPGFDLVAKALELSRRIAAADIVLTGEGRLDSQTLRGKGPGEVARRAKQRGVPTVIFTGAVDPSYDETAGLFDEVVVVTPAGGMPPADRDEAFARVERAAERWARSLGARR